MNNPAKVSHSVPLSHSVPSGTVGQLQSVINQYFKVSHLSHHNIYIYRYVTYILGHHGTAIYNNIKTLALSHCPKWDSMGHHGTVGQLQILKSK